MKTLEIRTEAFARGDTRTGQSPSSPRQIALKGSTPGAGGRRRSGLVKSAMLVVALAGLTGNAQARPLIADPSVVRQRASVDHICGSVLRLPAGEAHYDGCVASLMDTLETERLSHAVQQANEDCLAQGRERGSPDLAVCVVQTTESHPERAGPSVSIRELTTVRLAQPGGIKSYFSTSSEDRFRRSQLACALLAVNPAYETSSDCVADLQLTLFAIDNPAQ
jgi:hypothetical protein